MGSFKCNVFLSSIEDYIETNGAERGQWVELPQQVEELQRIYTKVMGSNEEYMLLDWECNCLDVGEYSNIFELNKMMQYLIDNVDETDVTKVLSVFEVDTTPCTLKDLEEVINHLDDVVFYEGDAEDILYEIAEDWVDSYNLPKGFNYIDYASLVRDLSYDYTATSWGLVWNY